MKKRDETALSKLDVYQEISTSLSNLKSNVFSLNADAILTQLKSVLDKAESNVANKKEHERNVVTDKVNEIRSIAGIAMKENVSDKRANKKPKNPSR